MRRGSILKKLHFPQFAQTRHDSSSFTSHFLVSCSYFPSGFFRGAVPPDVRQMMKNVVKRGEKKKLHTKQLFTRKLFFMPDDGADAQQSSFRLHPFLSPAPITFLGVIMANARIRLSSASSQVLTGDGILIRLPLTYFCMTSEPRHC